MSTFDFLMGKYLLYTSVAIILFLLFQGLGLVMFTIVPWLTLVMVFKRQTHPVFDRVTYILGCFILFILSLEGFVLGMVLIMPPLVGMMMMKGTTKVSIGNLVIGK